MPLQHGSSSDVKSANIKELMVTGKYPLKQSVAIALSNSKMHPKSQGGVAGSDTVPLAHYASGGFINSDIPGRTDRIPTSVQSDSYIIPADVISGLGQGNSLSGARIMEEIISGGHRPKFSNGGSSSAGSKVPVIIAGGEFKVSPTQVLRLGNGSMKRGHEILDGLIKNVRAHTIKQLKSLPPPRKK